MDHFGFFPIQALIYILNQTWAPFFCLEFPCKSLNLPVYIYFQEPLLI